jgi:sarcosine oxidase, subunit beta
VAEEHSIPERVDVAIVGSGIVGLSTAFHLAGMGRTSVAVFDRGPIGGVASPRAAGSIRHHYSHPLLVDLARRGHDFLRRFREHTGAECGYTNNGYLVGVDESQAGWLEENVRMVREAGVDTGLIDRSEVSRLFPQLDPEGWSGPVAFDRDAAYAQPQDVMRELARATAERGVTLLPGIAVTGLDVENRSVRGLITETGEPVRASVVVNAAGAWGAEVASLAGVDLPIRVQRLLQIFELRPGFHVPVTRPTLSDGPLDLYARPNPGNRILIGAREYFDAPQAPNDVGLYPNPTLIEDTRRRYEQLNPQAADASVFQAWAGIDGDTPDFQPIVGPVGGIDGFITAAGFSAHGFKLGPIIGQLLAELIVYGEYRTVDIGALGFERFETGDLFPPGYKQMGA